jgi:hypothetical protein
LLAQLQANLDEYDRVADEDALRTGIPRPTQQQLDDMEQNVLVPLLVRLGNAAEAYTNFRELSTPIDGTRTELEGWEQLSIQQNVACQIVCPIHGNVCECETGLQLVRISN